ncbi:MAG: hypothetical protein L6R42_001581 [Xanthoria sp. 1 TBL-2021]|nr:MAG: hypothetical protein L6R42_001581 [Xanthoria sp. 1 TBL-2021]
MDSGAGRHLSRDQKNFRLLSRLERMFPFSIASATRKLTFNNVLFAPGLPFSPLSVKALFNNTCVPSSMTSCARWLILYDDARSGTHANAFHAAVTSSRLPLSQRRTATGTKLRSTKGPNGALASITNKSYKVRHGQDQGETYGLSLLTSSSGSPGSNIVDLFRTKVRNAFTAIPVCHRIGALDISRMTTD